MKERTPVRNEADVFLKEAQEHLDQAIENLAKIVVKRDVLDQYIFDYGILLKNAFIALMGVRDSIKK